MPSEIGESRGSIHMQGTSAANGVTYSPAAPASRLAKAAFGRCRATPIYSPATRVLLPSGLYPRLRLGAYAMFAITR